jgi:hypothetical protein
MRWQCCWLSERSADHAQRVQSSLGAKNRVPLPAGQSEHIFHICHGRQVCAVRCCIGGTSPVGHPGRHFVDCGPSVARNRAAGAGQRTLNHNTHTLQNRIVAAFALLALLIPPALLGLALAFQRHLLSPKPKANAVLATPHHAIQAASIPMNGQVLRGSLARSRTGAAKLGPMSFHCRHEHPVSVFRSLQAFCFFRDRLGPSWHEPNEQEPVCDGIAVLDWWAQTGTMPIGSISLAGRILGSGIAVQVAAARSVRRLALLPPHDHLISAVRARLG